MRYCLLCSVSNMCSSKNRVYDSNELAKMEIF